MPEVPTQRQGPRLVDPTSVEPKFLAMAAAMMHEQGRLFDPTPIGEPGSFEKSPNQRVKEGHSALDREPGLYGDRGSQKLYLDKQDKYVVGETT